MKSKSQQGVYSALAIPFTVICLTGIASYQLGSPIIDREEQRAKQSKDFLDLIIKNCYKNDHITLRVILNSQKINICNLPSKNKIFKNYLMTIQLAIKCLLNEALSAHKKNHNRDEVIFAKCAIELINQAQSIHDSWGWICKALREPTGLIPKYRPRLCRRSTLATAPSD